MFKKIEDIVAWQESRVLAKDIWEVTNIGSFAKDYGLKDQINRAAGSVMDNIAEGFGRGGNREFAQFLTISRGSAQEVKSQLYRAFDRGHVQEEILGPLMEQSTKVIKLVHALHKMVTTSRMRGSKFQNRSGYDQLEDPSEPYSIIDDED